MCQSMVVLAPRRLEGARVECRQRAKAQGHRAAFLRCPCHDPESSPISPTGRPLVWILLAKVGFLRAIKLLAIWRTHWSLRLRGSRSAWFVRPLGGHEVGGELVADEVRRQGGHGGGAMTARTEGTLDAAVIGTAIDLTCHGRRDRQNRYNL
jgi:hypothetical protein